MWKEELFPERDVIVRDEQTLGSNPVRETK